jgi:hypothetical protein
MLDIINVDVGIIHVFRHLFLTLKLSGGNDIGASGIISLTNFALQSLQYIIVEFSGKGAATAQCAIHICHQTLCGWFVLRGFYGCSRSSKLFRELSQGWF